MRPLYLAPAVRASLSETLRPGGLVLTRRLSSLLKLEGCAILDAGCGCGASLHELQKQRPAMTLGLDSNPELLAHAREKGIAAIMGDMAALPLRNGWADVVFSECAWNLSRQQMALAEFYRVLRPGGALVLIDIYRRNPSQQTTWPLPCCLAGAPELDKAGEMVAAAGFIVNRIEDHSRLLKETAAHFIFQFGSLHNFWRAVTGSDERAAEACSSGKKMMPGLFLLLARRPGTS